MSLEKNLYKNCTGPTRSLYSLRSHVIAEWKEVTQSGIKASEDRRKEENRKIAESRKYERVEQQMNH